MTITKAELENEFNGLEKTKMDETNTTQSEWLAKEVEAIEKNTPTEYEQLPSLKLVEGSITEITVDFSKPFESWTDDSDSSKKITKKIIPVISGGKKMNWWLNVRNPVYREIITAGKAGQTLFKVLQTGNKKTTKYIIVK